MDTLIDNNIEKKTARGELTLPTVLFIILNQHKIFF